jgi:hypothetical protein
MGHCYLELQGVEMMLFLSMDVVHQVHYLYVAMIIGFLAAIIAGIAMESRISMSNVDEMLQWIQSAQCLVVIES